MKKKTKNISSSVLEGISEGTVREISEGIPVVIAEGFFWDEFFKTLQKISEQISLDF